MATDLLIQPLEVDPADFPPLPLNPGFAQLASDELGDAATPADGFDGVFNEVVAIVDALDTALEQLGLDLLDAFAESDTIDAAPVSDTVTGFAGSLDPSSSAVDDLGNQLAGVSQGAPAPTPTPGGGGGGTGTSPGGGAPGSGLPVPGGGGVGGGTEEPVL